MTSSSDVWCARRRLCDLETAVLEETFYLAMSGIFDKEAWRSYIDDVNGATLTFSSIDEFLTSKDGLCLRDLGLFQTCLKAVAATGAPMAQ